MGGGEPVDGWTVRWAGQRAKRREEIVAAGLAAIGEYGAGVSTEQIAQCAGILRPRLYRHFTDAEDLYGAIGVRVADPGLLMYLLASGMTDTTTLSTVLTRDLGLAGMTGTSGDMREVVAARDTGDEDARSGPVVRRGGTTVSLGSSDGVLVDEYPGLGTSTPAEKPIQLGGSCSTR